MPGHRGVLKSGLVLKSLSWGSPGGVSQGDMSIRRHALRETGVDADALWPRDTRRST